MSDTQCLQIAIARSKESATAGSFPAGAVIVAEDLGEPPTYSTISGNTADFRHAELKAIEGVVKQLQRNLDGVILYASMEPCIMCLTAAYWSGIRKIVYAIPKSRVKADYYGTELTTEEVNSKLLEPLDIIHLEELEEQALLVVHDWESQNEQKS